MYDTFMAEPFSAPEPPAGRTAPAAWRPALGSSGRDDLQPHSRTLKRNLNKEN